MENYEKFLHKDYYAIRNFCMAFPSIYLYGAGDIGERMLEYLELLNVAISGFLVSDGHRSQATFHGYPVCEISDVFIDEKDGIILAVSPKKQAAIERILENKCVPPTHLYLQKVYGDCEGDASARIESNALLPMDSSNKQTFFRPFTELDCIGKKHGTDKCSGFHDYLDKYEFFLHPWRNESFHLLELGILEGNSLHMWEEYFPKAQIWGVDIDPKCKQHDTGNTHVIITDLSKSSNILSLKDQITGQPSVIVDDASHLWSHQIKSLFSLFPYLANGGIYILEDLETSFRSYRSRGYDDASVSAYEVCAAIAEVVASREHLQEKGKAPAILDLSWNIEAVGAEVDMISFIHGSCIMVKK